MVNKFTQKAQEALSAALTAAEELGHSYIGTEHLLLGLIAQKESIASRILTLRGASEAKLKKSIVDYMGIGSQSDISSKDMTPRLQLIIESAAKEAEKSGIRYVGTEHLLISLLNRRDCVALRLLEMGGVPVSDIKTDLAAYLGSSPSRVREASARSDEQAKKGKKSVLLTYGRDLTALAREGKTDPVFCRSEETDRIIRILCRRSKNNPCLIGEPGVGKTAVVEGLAQRIVCGQVPPELSDKKIITLDISSMIAGAKFRGEFEDRIKGVIDEVRADPSIILFVDEMHIMVGAGAAEGAIDASNILKPSLSRGEIRMIGASTPSEYRSNIEKDSALERRFQPVKLEEPSFEEAITILEGLKDRYEKHHRIKISDEAIREAVRLSVRYIHDRFLPDKAIDLLDEAAAELKLDSTCHSMLPSLSSSLEYQKEEAIKRGDFSEASRISAQEQEMQSGSSIVLLQKVLVDAPTLTPQHIAEIVSDQTGIPIMSITSPEDSRLNRIEDSLSEYIIGQDAAVNAVASAIRRGKSGLCDPNRPTGSFLFLGSTGVGKTELCKALATVLFDKKDSLIRLDMSEYMEKHSVSKLIGAPPGYVGYGEGGLLTEKVRRHPYSVILFDEIEKAHPDVLHILLQILEDGILTDSSGRATDFSSTVIIMTSNLISSGEHSHRALGFSDERVTVSDKTLRSDKKLNDFFKPEFLNRIDEIILFSALGEKELCQIAQLMLNKLSTQASESGIDLLIHEEVARAIAKKCFSLYRDMGARPIRREIRDMIETPLAEHIINLPDVKSSPILVGVREEGVFFSFE